MSKKGFDHLDSLIKDAERKVKSSLPENYTHGRDEEVNDLIRKEVERVVYNGVLENVSNQLMDRINGINLESCSFLYGFISKLKENPQRLYGFMAGILNDGDVDDSENSYEFKRGVSLYEQVWNELC